MGRRKGIRAPGKEIRFMTEPDQPIRTRDGHTVTVDFFRPKDAEGITALFHNVYGESYPIRLYYDPHAVIQGNAAGTCCAIVARNEKGLVVGVTHVIHSAPYEGIYESAAGLVHKDYRKHGINNRLQWFLFHRWVPSRSGIAGIFGEPVCHHTHLQKNWYELGTVEMGIELALMPGAAFLADGNGPERVACMVAYRPVTPKPHRIYLPAIYTPAVRFLYADLPETRWFTPSTSSLPEDRRTQCHIEIFEFAAVARVAFQETGADLDESLKRMEQEVEGRGVKVIQIWLKLGDPWIGAAVDVFHDNGYFLGGILPRWFDDDGLLMQKLWCSPCWQGIHPYTDRAQKILELVRADQKGVLKKI